MENAKNIQQENVSVVLKISFNSEIRRIALRDRPLTVREVHANVHALFPNVAEYTLTYTDEEGDIITISSDEEVAEALRPCPSGFFLRLTISCPSPSASSPSSRLASSHAPSADEQFVHWAVCDGCGVRIRGVRYKCAVCPDFDLCATCEAEGMRGHPRTHAMVKLTKANAHSQGLHTPPWPSATGRSPCHPRVGAAHIHPIFPSAHSPDFGIPPMWRRWRGESAYTHTAHCLVGHSRPPRDTRDSIFPSCVTSDIAHSFHPLHRHTAVIRRPHRECISLSAMNRCPLHTPPPPPSLPPSTLPSPPPPSSSSTQSPLPSCHPPRRIFHTHPLIQLSLHPKRHLHHPLVSSSCDEVPKVANSSPDSSESVDGNVLDESEKQSVAGVTLHSMDESEDRKATRSVLTTMGLSDDVITQFMDRLGSDLEVIANAVYDERDAE